MFDAVGMVGNFASWSYLFGTSDDDWIDRFNHIWTVTLLGLFSIVITSGQYILGNPIQCWTPAELKEQFILYTHSTCWISNTYYVPIYEEIPDDISERQEAEMTYYQWVPIILLFQAFLFKIPNITWRLLNGYSGIRMDKITTLAEDTVMSPPDDREKKIKLMAKYIDCWILTQQNYKHNLVVHLRHKISSICCFCFGKREGTFLTGYYLFIKFLYCVNVIGQFFLLNEFMAMDYNNFGFEIIQYYIKHGEWSESPRFPRVTLCDFIIRQITNQQRYTVQCVMPLNLLNEKIFVFQWFWLFILATLTCLNFVSWIYYVSSQENNFWYIKKHLKICKEIHSRNDLLLARLFTQEHLRDDGVFVLRVLEKNSSTFITSDLILNLWTIFRQRHYEKVKMITQTENADLGVDIGDSI
ncbi:innexin unc-9-like [Mytilus galloprovincialis]|uniref:innexin unc-9-like n=1 Tax=Mytilus galloprovincialis TaxID=29158 RepID=UPI003F7BC3F1